MTIEDDIGFSSVCPHRVYFFLWLAKLVPNAKRITNPNSGHEIHKEQPQLVIASWDFFFPPPPAPPFLTPLP